MTMKTTEDENGGTNAQAVETAIVAGGHAPGLRQKRKVGGWTAARRKIFLDHLAATCNIQASADMVGMSRFGLYQLRQRDENFAHQYRTALTTGYDRLEAELLRKAIATVDGVVGDPDAAIAAPMTVDQAMRLLERYRATCTESATKRLPRNSRATQAETDAVLLAQIKGLRRRRERKA